MGGVITGPLADAATRPARTTHPFAWQGWRLRVPASWNPVKLEGDFDKGYALLADLDGPRLGLRWSVLKAKDFTQATLRGVIRDEAGDEAAERAKPLPDPDQPQDGADGLVHLDPNPPGRDVYVWWSASHRLLEVVYHAAHRDNVLVGEIIPSLADVSFLTKRQWAVFDLACSVPAEFTLTSRRLNAGDLALEFGHGKRFVIVRQIALAAIALRRIPLANWLAEQQRERRLRYRAKGETFPLELRADDGRELNGLMGTMRRRRRFAWMRGLPAERVAVALQDAARDRLVLVEASDEPLALDVARSCGCDVD
jgi:hypothetical protein